MGCVVDNVLDIVLFLFFNYLFLNFFCRFVDDGINRRVPTFYFSFIKKIQYFILRRLCNSRAVILRPIISWIYLTLHLL